MPMMEKQSNLETPLSTNSTHLLSLPGEVRNIIYGYLLDTSDSKRQYPTNVKYDEYKGTIDALEYDEPPYQVDISIMYTCKLVYKEASDFFYRTNKFVRFIYCIPHPGIAKSFLEHVGMPFFRAPIEAVAKCKRHSLDVQLFRDVDDPPRLAVMFSIQFLAHLVGFFETSMDGDTGYGPHHGLVLTLKTRLFPDQVNRDEELFLDPWRTLYDFRAVVVDKRFASVDDKYAQQLQNDMTSNKFNPNKYLARLQSCKDKAADLFRAGNIKDALVNFMVIRDQVNGGFSDSPTSRVLELQAQNQEYGKAITRLRFQLELNVAIAFFKLHFAKQWAHDTGDNSVHHDLEISSYDPNIAFTAIADALEICTDILMHHPWHTENAYSNDGPWFSAVEKAKAFYWFGVYRYICCEYDLAISALGKAERLTPNDPAIKSALKKANKAYRMNF